MVDDGVGGDVCLCEEHLVCDCNVFMQEVVPDSWCRKLELFTQLKVHSQTYL